MLQYFFLLFAKFSLIKLISSFWNYSRLEARPDFAELDVFFGQNILLTLEQHFNQKI